MSEEATPPPAGEPVTEELPARTLSVGVIGGGWSEQAPPTGSLDEHPDEEWPVRGPKRGLRIPVPAAILVVLLVGAGGIWGGAVLQRGQGGGSSSASALRSAFSRLRSGGGGFGGFGGTGGTGGLGGAASAAATGTVTEVSGDLLYVTTSSGSLVKVVLGKGATVTRTATTPLSGLKLGDTVVVQGATAKGGTVTATSVTATAAGVHSTTGGFGGFGGTSTGGAGGSAAGTSGAGGSAAGTSGAAGR